jgi:hypothetical protein
MYDEKIIIAGSRTFNYYTLLKEVVDAVLVENQIKNPLIISGGANGADKLGERYAKERGFDWVRFPAKWQDENGNFDRAAGIKRNSEMAKYATALIAFIENDSSGTTHMIRKARKMGLKIKVINR